MHSCLLPIVSITLFYVSFLHSKANLVVLQMLPPEPHMMSMILRHLVQMMVRESFCISFFDGIQCLVITKITKGMVTVLLHILMQTMLHIDLQKFCCTNVEK